MRFLLLFGAVLLPCATPPPVPIAEAAPSPVAKPAAPHAPTDCRPLRWRAMKPADVSLPEVLPRGREKPEPVVPGNPWANGRPLGHLWSQGRWVFLTGVPSEYGSGFDRAAGTLYDPATDRWAPLPPAGAPARTSDVHHEGLAFSVPVVLTQPFGDRLVTSAVWMDSANGQRSVSAFLDAADNRWIPVPREGAPPKVVDAAIIAAKDSVYVVPHDSEWSFDPSAIFRFAQGRWTRLPPAPLSKRVGLAIAAADDGLFLFGGLVPGPDEGRKHPAATVKGDGALWDGAAWSALPSGGPGPGAHLAAVGLPGTVLLAGEHRPPILFDLATKRWVATDQDPLSGQASSPARFLWTGRRLVHNVLARPIEIFDPATRNWSTGPTIPGGVLLPLEDGRIFVWSAEAPQVLLPEQGKLCPVELPAIPLFAPRPGWTTYHPWFVAGGNEILIFGRIDNLDPPPCPPGAPCAAPRVVRETQWMGVVLTP